MFKNLLNSSDKYVSFTHPISPPLFELLEILNFDAAALKPFNLILIPISFLLYVSKYRLSIKSISRLFFFLLSATIIPFLYYFFIYFKLGDLIVPNNQDLKIAIYSDDSARNISYVFSNLIFYIGYLQFITLPFTINFKFRHHKNFISLITFL